MSTQGGPKRGGSGNAGRSFGWLEVQGRTSSESEALRERAPEANARGQVENQDVAQRAGLSTESRPLTQCGAPKDSSKSVLGSLERSAARRHKYSWIFSSYFAEGLPWSLLHQVAAEFFTAIGAAPSQVGKTALLHIPILLKVVLSPVVEAVGTLRRWMITTLGMMGVLVGCLAVFAHAVATSAAPQQAQTLWIWVLLFSIGLLSAAYDIACDGFYMEELDETDQAFFSGYRVAAYRAAMLLGSFLLVFLGGFVHWLLGFGVGAALLLGLSAVSSWVLPARGARLVSGTAASRRSTRFDSYLSFLRQPAIVSVLAFLLLYKAADAMMFAMSSVLLGRHLGIGTDLRATLGTFSMVASIAGAILGGAWVARYGLARALFPITLLMVVTEPLFALLAWAAPELSLFVEGEPMTVSTLDWSQAAGTLSLVAAVSVVEKLCAGFAVAAQTVFIMQRAHPAHKTAHYAFATVVYSVAQIGLGVSSGVLFERLGPTGYYVLVSLIALPTLGLARIVPLDGRAD